MLGAVPELLPQLSSFQQQVSQPGQNRGGISTNCLRIAPQKALVISSFYVVWLCYYVAVTPALHHSLLLCMHCVAPFTDIQ